jgi:hypothetical protein
MLTESREAMNLIWPPQNLAIASLSSPHFDANPFLPAADRSTPRRCYFVITGLDPAIHLFEESSKKMDARVKPAHDAFGAVALPYETRF